MSSLYKAVGGSVIRSQLSSPTFISVDGMDSLLRGDKMMLTSIRINRSQDVLLVKTLANLYYIYSFGEAPGKVEIGGLMFFADCRSNSVDGSAIGMLNDYYDQNNAYAKDTPVRIAGGGVSFSCILQGFSVNAEMNEFNYAAFSMSFILVPKR